MILGIDSREKKLLKLIEVSKQFINQMETEIDYQKIAEDMLQLSGAKYVGLNLFCDESKNFRTVGLSGDTDAINLAKDMLGFDPIGYSWNSDPSKTERIKDNNITVFNCLRDLVNRLFPDNVVELFEKRFELGKIIVIKIIKDGVSRGDFTLFMGKEDIFYDNEIVEIYASQVGLFIDKIKAEKLNKEAQEKRIIEKQQLINIIEGTNAGTWEWNVQTGETVFNQRWAEIIGYTLDEISPINIETWNDLVHSDDLIESEKKLKRVFEKKEEYYSFVYRMKHKDGYWVWVLDRGKVISWGDNGKPFKMFGTHLDITENKNLEQKIIDRENKYRVLVENSYDIIYRLSVEGIFTYLSQAWNLLLGQSIEEAIGKSFRPFVHPDDIPKLNSFFDNIKLQNRRLAIEGYRLKHIDGSWHWYTTNATPIWDEFGNIIGYAGTARDVTENKRMEESLYIEKELFRTTLLSVGDGVIATDDKGHITIINQIAQSLIGLNHKEAVGKYLDEVFSIRHESNNLPWINLAIDVIETGDIIELTNILLLSKLGQQIPIESSAAPIKNRRGDITGVAIVFRDFTDKKEKQKHIEYLSFHDHLTGLYNKRYLEDAIKRLDSSRNLPLTIMALDVNGLKLTNDAFGHDMGDKLLKTVAEILSKTCRSDDIICRVGGDEFVILLPNTNTIQAENIKQRIIEKALETELESIIVSLAIGYSIKTRIDKDILEVQKIADNNMYKSKLKYGKTMRSKTIEIILSNLNSKYDKEKKHSEMVSLYCEKIAKAMKLSEKEIRNIKKAGFFHDIGKITIAPELLNKGDKLTVDEFEVIKRHTETSYQILKSVDEYIPFAEEVLYHHEKVDGTGYPFGLKGDKIPLNSRIIAIADAYEAMVGERSYKKSMAKEEAISELNRCAGTQFDPEIVKIFIEKVLLNSSIDI